MCLSLPHWIILPKTQGLHLRGAKGYVVNRRKRQRPACQAQLFGPGHVVRELQQPDLLRTLSWEVKQHLPPWKPASSQCQVHRMLPSEGRVQSGQLHSLKLFCAASSQKRSLNNEVEEVFSVPCALTPAAAAGLEYILARNMYLSVLMWGKGLPCWY